VILLVGAIYRQYRQSAVWKLSYKLSTNFSLIYQIFTKLIVSFFAYNKDKSMYIVVISYYL